MFFGAIVTNKICDENVVAGVRKFLPHRSGADVGHSDLQLEALFLYLACKGWLAIANGRVKKMEIFNGICHEGGVVLRAINVFKKKN